jgi:chromosome segregation ATPase
MSGPFRENAIPNSELPPLPPPTVHVEVEILEAAVLRATEIDALVTMCENRLKDAEERRRAAHALFEEVRRGLREVAAAADWLDAFVSPPAVSRASAQVGLIHGQLQEIDVAREMLEERRGQLLAERKKLHDQFEERFRAAVLFAKDRFR